MALTLKSGASQNSSPPGNSGAKLSRRIFGAGGFGYKQQLALLLVPYVIGLVLLVVVPALLSMGLAFTSYDALRPPVWIGLENFAALLGDWLFWNGLWSSLFYIAFAVPLRTGGALLLAFLLHRRSRANSFYRAVVYLPTIVPDVAYALLWLYIFNPFYGPLNWVLQLFGLPGQGWLLDPWPARFGIVLMMLWPIGEGFVLMMAAFQDMPREAREAAEVDGASGWQLFRHITLPLITPAILLLICRDTILSFQNNFVPALLTTGGGPYYATQYLPMYIWQNATEYGRFGYSSAMTWVLYALTAVIIFAQFAVARRWRDSRYD